MGKSTMPYPSNECNISEIVLPKDREANQVKVRELADSISTIGLINPIVISPAKELLAGLNRVEAFKLLGYTSIPANVVDVDELTRKLIRIDEDLIRKHLDVLDLGLLLNERKALLAEMGLLAKVGDNKHTMKSDTKTTKDLAKAIGKSARTVQRVTKVVKELAPEVIDDIKGTEAAKNLKVLTMLSHQEKDIQIEAAKKMRDGMAPSVAIRSTHREKTQDKLAKAAESYSLPESVQLHLGDFREASKAIPDESIQLIIADPLYCKDSVKDYRDIAIVANRVLKAGGFMVVYCGNLYMNEIFEGFKSAGLIYHWLGGVYFSNGQNTEMSRGVITKFRPVLFFRKAGTDKPIRFIHDVFSCTSDAVLHHYQQNMEPIRSWIMSLSEPDDTVLSPFLGTGTVGVAAVKEFRKFIGIDIDEKMFTLAEARIKAVASEKTEEMELKKAA